MKGIAKVAACALLLLASCEPGTPPDTEVAAELRALRAVLVQQQKSGAGAATAPTAVPDRSQITTALQPLREVLDGLVQSQRELQTRQLTLTQEMQRWSQLLVETATGARQDEAKAMTQRLQQLEKTLQAQDTRHREVEALMQGALDRTADRLEDFLRRLEGTVRPAERPPDPAGAPAGTPPIKGAAPGPANNGGNGQPANGATPPSPGGGEDDASASSGSIAAVRPTRHWSMFWWLLPAVLAAGLCIAFFLRLRRLSNQTFVATASPPAGPEHMEVPCEPELDRGVQEIWSAAALLGEAVGRLKQTAASEVSPPPPAPPATARDGVGLSEIISVVGDEVGNGVSPPARAVAETATARAAPARANSMNQLRNTAVRCRLPGISPAQAQTEILRLLADDPRVLRRPEPVMTATPTAVEVAFHVLPGLPASERSQIEQRFRDALAEPAAGSTSWVSQRAGGVAIVLPPFPPSEQHHA